MKLVDGFLFYNEFEMLSLRFKELYDTVDYFVLVESSKTFAGNEKELLFYKNKHKYEEYLDKVIHIMVVDSPHSNNSKREGLAFENEFYQRRSIDVGIKNLDLEDDDLIIISDCDEICDPETLQKIKEEGLDDTSILRMDMYNYNLECRGAGWYKVKILNYRMYKLNDCDCQKIRRNPFSRSENTNVIPRGGWHFSYFGDVEFIKNKIKNFSHQGFNSPKYLDNDAIQTAIDDMSDLYGREGLPELTKVEIEANDYLPKHYRLLLE